MNAHCSYVGTSLTGNPEDTHITLFIVLYKAGLVDRSDTELFLDGGNQWRSLEKSSGEGVDCLLKLLNFVKFCVKLNNGNVLFTS